MFILGFVSTGAALAYGMKKLYDEARVHSKELDNV